MGAAPLTVWQQGQGAVFAQWLNAVEVTTDLVSDLSGFVGVTGMQVACRGQSAVNDGGGGDFYWASGPHTNDGTNTIVPNGAINQGAWLRLSSFNSSFGGLTFTNNFEGSGHGGATTTAPFGFADLTPQPGGTPDWLFVGNYAYVGGAAGVVKTTLNVTASVAATVSDYVWAFTSSMLNSATGGNSGPQNAGGVFEGNMLVAGCSATWALNTVALDRTGSGSTGKGGLTSIEADVYINGLDAAANRIALNVVVGDGQHAQGLPPGAYGTCEYAIVIQAQQEGTVQDFVTGIYITSATGGGVVVGVGTSAANAVIRAFAVQNYAQVGFDTSLATLSGAAIRMAASQVIALDATSQNTMGYYSGNGVVYQHNGSPVITLSQTGAIGILGLQVLGAQIAGYGTPTGGSRSPLTPGSATTTQICTLLNQLILDCEMHGFIAA